MQDLALILLESEQSVSGNAVDHTANGAGPGSAGLPPTDGCCCPLLLESEQSVSGNAVAYTANGAGPGSAGLPPTDG